VGRVRKKTNVDFERPSRWGTDGLGFGGINDKSDSGDRV